MQVSRSPTAGYNRCRMRSKQQESREEERRRKNLPRKPCPACPVYHRRSRRRAVRRLGRLLLCLQPIRVLRRRAGGCSRIWSSRHETTPVVRLRSTCWNRDDGGEAVVVECREHLAISSGRGSRLRGCRQRGRRSGWGCRAQGPSWAERLCRNSSRSSRLGGLGSWWP